MKVADPQKEWNLRLIKSTQDERDCLIKAVRRNCQCHKMLDCPACELLKLEAFARLVSARRDNRWHRGEWSR